MNKSDKIIKNLIFAGLPFPIPYLQMKGFYTKMNLFNKGTFLAYFICSIVFFLPETAVHAFKCDVTASAISFGNYDTLSPLPAYGTGSISVNCNIPAQNPNAPLPVTLSLSPGNSGSVSQRWLDSVNGVHLYYNIYTDPSYGTVLGESSTNTVTNKVTSASPWNLTIYGRIQPLQNVSVGRYADVLTATITW